MVPHLGRYDTVWPTKTSSELCTSYNTPVALTKNNVCLKGLSNQCMLSMVCQVDRCKRTVCYNDDRRSIQKATQSCGSSTSRTHRCTRIDILFLAEGKRLISLPNGASWRSSVAKSMQAAAGSIAAGRRGHTSTQFLAFKLK